MRPIAALCIPILSWIGRSCRLSKQLTELYRLYWCKAQRSIPLVFLSYWACMTSSIFRGHIQIVSERIWCRCSHDPQSAHCPLAHAWHTGIQGISEESTSVPLSLPYKVSTGLSLYRQDTLTYQTVKRNRINVVIHTSLALTKCSMNENSLRIIPLY